MLARLALIVVLSCLVAAIVVQAASSNTISWNAVNSSPGFGNREYAYCAQQPASTSSGASQNLYLWGGYSPIFASTTNGTSHYTNTYYSDAWISTNGGASWTNQTASTGLGLPGGEGWGGAAYLSNGNILLVAGGEDATASQFNTVYISTNGGASFSASVTGPFQPREDPGFAVLPNTNNVVLALGSTNSAYTDDIWYSTDGRGAVWTLACSGNSSQGTGNNPCPLLNSASGYTTGAVHGPALVGLYDSQTWVLMGGYDSNAAGTYFLVSNQVAYSTNYFVSSSVYTAPWAPRGQARAVSDTNNYVYITGGVYPIAPTSSYVYYNDVWVSTNAASSSASWTQISASGISQASYGSSSAIFNPCLAFIWSNNQRTLVSYTGIYAYYIQNNVQSPQYPPVYSGVYTPNSAAGVYAPTVLLITMTSILAASVLLFL